jgi:hypothetical protein
MDELLKAVRPTTNHNLGRWPCACGDSWRLPQRYQDVHSDSPPLSGLYKRVGLEHSHSVTLGFFGKMRLRSGMMMMVPASCSPHSKSLKAQASRSEDNIYMDSFEA